MSVIPLRGERREHLGKNATRKARAAGMIPGVVYGHGDEPIPVVIDGREFHLAMGKHRGGNAIVNLAVNEGEYTALIREVQYDPLTHHILHLDFHHISLTESVEVKVPVRLTGVPVGVKDGGGVLELITREVEVRCLPTAIPPAIEVDVSALNIGDSVHVRDLAVGDWTVLVEPSVTIATVVPPTVIEEKPAEEAVAAAAATEEPEVIAKGKKEEEEATEKKA